MTDLTGNMSQGLLQYDQRWFIPLYLSWQKSYHNATQSKKQYLCIYYTNNNLYAKTGKGKCWYSSSWKCRLRDTGLHLSYGITHLTQINAPRLIPAMEADMNYNWLQKINGSYVCRQLSNRNDTRQINRDTYSQTHTDNDTHTYIYTYIHTYTWRDRSRDF